MGELRFEINVWISLLLQNLPLLIAPYYSTEVALSATNHKLHKTASIPSIASQLTSNRSSSMQSDADKISLLVSRGVVNAPLSQWLSFLLIFEDWIAETKDGFGSFFGLKSSVFLEVFVVTCRNKKQQHLPQSLQFYHCFCDQFDLKGCAIRQECFWEIVKVIAG